jgi:hypothetical protein
MSAKLCDALSCLFIGYFDEQCHDRMYDHL